MEHQFEIAARTCTSSEFSLILENGRGCVEFSESLEGDCGRDRIQRCHLLTSFQEGPHQSRIFFQNSASKMANCSIVDIVIYLMLLPANSLQLIFYFLFPFTKI